MTLLSELRSKDYGEGTMYSYLYQIKYDDFIDSREIEVDFINDVDIAISRHNLSTRLSRHSRLVKLFDDDLDEIIKCSDCGAYEYEDEMRYAYEDDPLI